MIALCYAAGVAGPGAHHAASQGVYALRARGKSDTVFVSVVKSERKVCKVIACSVRFTGCGVAYHMLSRDLRQLFSSISLL